MEFVAFNSKIHINITINENGIDDFPSLKKLKRGNTRDIVYKLNGLLILLGKESFSSYAEPMAGVGFSAKMVEALQNPSTIVLNDISEELGTLLLKNIPHSTITHIDCLTQEYIAPLVECTFIDFNNFTMNRERYVENLKRLIPETSRIVLLTDVFAYSLKPFNIEKFEAYSDRISSYFLKSYSLYLSTIYIYPNHNAAIMKFTKTKGKDNYVVIDDVDDTIIMNRQYQNLLNL